LPYIVCVYVCVCVEGTDQFDYEMCERESQLPCIVCVCVCVYEGERQVWVQGVWVL